MFVVRGKHELLRHYTADQHQQITPHCGKFSQLAFWDLGFQMNHCSFCNFFFSITVFPSTKLSINVLGNGKHLQK